MPRKRWSLRRGIGGGKVYANGSRRWPDSTFGGCSWDSWTPAVGFLFASRLNARKYVKICSIRVKSLVVHPKSMSMTLNGKPDPDGSGARRFWGRMLIIFAAAGLACAADAQFVSFYDHAPGRFTHSNAVDYGVAGSGLLKNVANGASVGVTVTVTNSGAVYYPYAGVPDYGTPASIVFDGFVDFGGQPNPSITLPASSSVLAYTFSGLDPNSEYNFQGSAMRGDWSFTNQWSRFQLVGAAAFTSAHSAGALTTAQVPSIASNEVAINTGNNVQGVLAWWEHIRPGAAGTFS